jgi:hypothetical protein
MVVQVRFDCKNLSELIGRRVVHDKFKHQQYCFERPKRKGLRGTSGASAPGGSRGDAAIVFGMGSRLRRSGRSPARIGQNSAELIDGIAGSRGFILLRIRLAVRRTACEDAVAVLRAWQMHSTSSAARQDVVLRRGARDRRGAEKAVGPLAPQKGNFP